MIGFEPVFDLEMIEQLDRLAGILTGDPVRIFQRLHRPPAHIAEIADGRSDEDQLPAHRFTSAGPEYSVSAQARPLAEACISPLVIPAPSPSAYRFLMLV